MASFTPPGTNDLTMLDLVAPQSPITVTWNQFIDPTTVTSADFKLFKGVGADCTGGTEVVAANIGFFQGQDATMSVADPLSVEIYDTTAAGVITNPADPTSMGNFFTPSDRYRLELQTGASASDIGGGSGDITIPPDAMGNPIMSICFDVDTAS